MLFAVIPPNVLPPETPGAEYVELATEVAAPRPVPLLIYEGKLLVNVEVALTVTLVVTSTVLLGKAEIPLIPLVTEGPEVATVELLPYGGRELEL